MPKYPFKDTITIRVPGHGRGENEDSGGNLVSSEKDKFGGIFTRPDAEFLPRRIIKEGLINFYDLGQIKFDNGKFYDINFSNVRDVNLSGAGRYILILEDYQIRDAFFLSIPVDEWKTKFRRFEKKDAYKYNLMFSGGNGDDGFGTNFRSEVIDDEIFTDKGVKVTGKNLSDYEIQIYNRDVGGYDTNYFSSFHIRSNNVNELPKITIEPFFEAEEVEFTMSREMDIFLPPLIVVQVSDIIHWYNYPPSGYPYYEYVVNKFPRLRNREILFDEDNEFYNKKDVGSVYWGSSEQEYQAAWDALMIQKSFPNSRVVKFRHEIVNGQGIRTNLGNVSLDEIPPSFFPPPPSFPLYVNGSENGSGFFTFIGTPAVIPQKVLLAVINKDNNWYYFWETG